MASAYEESARASHALRISYHLHCVGLDPGSRTFRTIHLVLLPEVRYNICLAWNRLFARNPAPWLEMCSCNDCVLYYPYHRFAVCLDNTRVDEIFLAFPLVLARNLSPKLLSFINNTSIIYPFLSSVFSSRYVAHDPKRCVDRNISPTNSA